MAKASIVAAKQSGTLVRLEQKLDLLLKNAGIKFQEETPEEPIQPVKLSQPMAAPQVEAKPEEPAASKPKAKPADAKK